MPARRTPARRKKAAPASAGLTAVATAEVRDAALDQLADTVTAGEGAVLARYREPVGGTPALLVALPIDRVEPTPYQRDPSDAHVKRLMAVLEKIGRFLDPIILIRHEDRYWTPNGNHRLQAMKRLGYRAIIGLLVPDPDVAFKILALNTEKAHNLKEKSLETIRMARALAGTSDAPETRFAFEFEQPAFLTLGACYEARPRLGGGAYQSILRRVDAFLDLPMPKALRERERRARLLLHLDDAVAAAAGKLKAKGFTSPYLRAFVVARVNYTRFSKATSFDFDEALDRIIASAKKFNVDKVRPEDVARSGGGPPDEE
jgi:ParB family chromosome partitioning protein